MAPIEDLELVKHLQQAQMKILLELDRVCNMLGLEYCLAFGTCLGAVRHKGFIPWDDDIDVYMRNEDLETLAANADLFEDNFFLQNHESDPEYGLMISRLRDSQTTLIEKNEIQRDMNHGIFIDIYPLFNSPKEGWGAKKLLLASMLYRLFLYGVAPRNKSSLVKIGATVLLKTVPKRVQKNIVQQTYQTMCAAPKTGYISNLYGFQEKVRLPYEWFFPVKRVPFEDVELPIHANADEYLKVTYGDYMQLPPVEKRMVHHDYTCIDFEKSFIEYKGIEYCKS